MSRAILETINTESIAFAREFITQRKASLLRRKADASGELNASLDYEVTKQATDEAVTLFLMFAEQGRFIDMKQNSFNYEHDKWGRNAIERLINWIDKKGIQNFINGWLERRGITNTTQSSDKIKMSIAWGIAVNRTKGKFKRKIWWNRAKSAGITDLINDIAAALPKTVGEEITKPFNFKKYARAKGR